MLMFIFGAGASFDSDPERRPGEVEYSSDEEYRPPLAAGLFTPASRLGQELIDEFPRAAPLLMRLRQATRQGLDIEEVLEQIAVTEADYPATAIELLAFRSYLAKLLDTVPAAWLKECNGLTNYVLALAEADRWNAAVHGGERAPIACVSFNYDTLLEDAVWRVFGHSIKDMGQYTNHPAVHVLKPHGAVHWRQPAAWDVPQGHHIDGSGALTRAINQASSLEWRDDDAWAFIQNDRYQDSTDQSTVWLPALSVPVRRKTTFTMPSWHRETMIADLGRVSTVVAVGWRARERHFLQSLQDHLPSGPSRLVAVAETDAAAQEAVDHLWETGKFDRYALSGIGFSGFTEAPTEPFVRPSSTGNRTALTLRNVLTSGQDGAVWTRRDPGRGLSPEPSDSPFADPGYMDM